MEMKEKIKEKICIIISIAVVLLMLSGAIEMIGGSPPNTLPVFINIKTYPFTEYYSYPTAYLMHEYRGEPIIPISLKLAREMKLKIGEGAYYDFYCSHSLFFWGLVKLGWPHYCPAWDKDGWKGLGQQWKEVMINDKQQLVDFIFDTISGDGERWPGEMINDEQKLKLMDFVLDNILGNGERWEILNPAGGIHKQPTQNSE